jgi:hypothetical protein
MRGTARAVAFFAALGVIVAGLAAQHAGKAARRWLCGEFWDGFSPRYRSLPIRAAARACSLAASWRRPEARHARPQLPAHPRPYIPGIGHLDVPLDVKPVPFPPSMPTRAEMTVMDFPPALARPYLTHARPGRPAAGMRKGAA